MSALPTPRADALPAHGNAVLRPVPPRDGSTAPADAEWPPSADSGASEGVTLGDLIATYRWRRGLSMNQLDLETGLSHGATARMESGATRRASARTLHAFAGALALSDAERAALLTFTAEPGGHAPQRLPGSPFGAALRRHREAAGLSCIGLGRLAGIGATTVCRLESGDRGPSAAMIGKLAGALDLDAADADRLLIAAGFAPAADADLGTARWLLCGDGVPADVRAQFRQCVRALGAAARR